MSIGRISRQRPYRAMPRGRAAHCLRWAAAATTLLALTAASAFGDAELKVAYKLGVTDQEIRKLCEAVRKALDKGPLDPEEIRQTVGKASRGLGEEGKKKGLTTTLPLALGKLQSTGDIRRVPLNGRLDQQRHLLSGQRRNQRR